MLQVNDTVRLINPKCQECEFFSNTSNGWLDAEKSKPQLGDTFKIISIQNQQNSETWLELEGLYYEHPASKFLKVDKI